MLRKQAKRILLVMLFMLTFVLAGRVDTNAQTAAPAGVKQVKAGSSSVTVQWDAVMQNDICYYYRISNDSSFNSSISKRNYDERVITSRLEHQQHILARLCRPM